MAQHQGTYDAISLQPAQRWTPRGGFITNPRTKLLNTSVASFTASLRANGYAYEVEPLGESPYSIVTTLAVEPDATADTILNDLWELDGNDLEKDYWNAPSVKEFLSVGNSLQKADVKRIVETFVREGGDVDDMTREVARALTVGARNTLTAEEDAILNLIVADLVAGTQSFAVATYVLRRTVTVPAGTTLAPSFGNANKIFTSAQLVATETTIPLNLRASLPDGYWQKKTPTASQQPDGRWVYRVEYWWAEEYSTMLYETAS